MNTTRCAIYTRKSSEEGLDQAFNSLDAQREAGLDYVRSQKHEGWEAIDQVYDDGGFSGGTMKRPALEKLLEDIDRGRIDVVVVYKVDRLSRSLGDFARMMQLFDEKKISFVSVTQQFNTTTSIGRLTLNMLLSFAQFEREVAGERIRDKIAATKKQGYWVCGQPPLGYRLQREDEERGLYIIPEEAETVRKVFERFVELKSPLAVASELSEQGFATKQWVSSTERVHGGKPLTPKYIHSVLTNPTYTGKVTHTRNGETTIYDGRHEPIIDQDTWDDVQRLINTKDRNTLHRWSQPHLIKGKLRTGDGFAISPSSTHRPLTKRGAASKGRGQKRLVRYYVSQKAIKHGFKSCPIKSINAEHLDDLVRGIILDFVDCQPLNAQQPEVRNHWIRKLIQQVVLTENRLSIEIDQDQLRAVRSHNFTPAAEPLQQHPRSLRTPKCEEDDSTIRLTLDIQFKKIDGRRLLLSPDGNDLVIPARPEPKQHIVEAIGLAYRWHNELTSSGEHIKPFTESRGIARTRIMKLLPLINLGPEILHHALAGILAPSMTLEDLLEAARHLDWTHQARWLGIDRVAATA